MNEVMKAVAAICWVICLYMCFKMLRVAWTCRRTTEAFPRLVLALYVFMAVSIGCAACFGMMMVMV